MNTFSDNNKAWDVLVAGLGSMGAAALYYLAGQNLQILGIEQMDDVPHDMGSHGGQSRIIRKAYFENPDYVPLLERAYHNWEELEKQTGEKLYYQTGLLYGGPGHHPLIRGVKESAEKYNIPLLPFTSPSVLANFNIQGSDTFYLEPGAGLLLPEKSIRLFIREARQKGAAVQCGETIKHWENSGDQIIVYTDQGTYLTRKLIITTGAWSQPWLNKEKPLLQVSRQLICWVEPPVPEAYTPDRFPCWMYCGESFSGTWYGFPDLQGISTDGPPGLKFAWHYPGEPTNPDRVKREISLDEINAMIREAGGYFLPANSRVIAAKTCLYTNSPDEDFIIDFLPGWDNKVIIAAGFSGHGFKFAPVVGEILTELAIDGKTNWPVDFLNLARFTHA